MASLSNINGLFDVHSTGAILFSTSHGTSGQILRSNGNAAPTWVAASTVIGGPYLPLTGGTLTGNLAINGSNSLTVGGALTGTSATFSSDVFSDGLYVNSTTAVPGTQVAIVGTGTENLQRWGSANSGQASYRFRIDQDYKFISNSGSGDNLTIYSDTGNIEGTTATFSGLVSGITPTAAANFATKAYVDAHPGSGGTVTGSGVAGEVAYWTSSTNIANNAGMSFSNEQLQLDGIGGADGFALPYDENPGYSNMSAGGFGILFREARDNYILGNAYWYKTGGTASWRAKYGAHAATMIGSDEGNITFETAPVNTTSPHTLTF